MLKLNQNKSAYSFFYFKNNLLQIMPVFNIAINAPVFFFFKSMPHWLSKE